MKKIATLLALLPSMSLAHGGHAPTPESLHAVSHTGPLLGLALICVVLGAVLYQRWAS